MTGRISIRNQGLNDVLITLHSDKRFKKCIDSYHTSYVDNILKYNNIVKKTRNLHYSTTGLQ